MLPFTQIDDQIVINDEIKILKKADYQSYLNGQEFINIAKQHAKKIENDADSIYQERYTAGWQEGLARRFGTISTTTSRNYSLNFNKLPNFLSTS